MVGDDFGGTTLNQITMEDARARLPELIAGLRPGDELQITDGDRAVARIVPEQSGRSTPRVPGSAIGKFFIVVDDDEHLDAFGEYMP